MRFRLILILSVLIAACSLAEPPAGTGGSAARLALRKHWTDSIYNRLSEEERIGQLFMVAAYSGGPNYNAPKIEALIRKHQIGGLIFMQGGPVRQALLTNHFQEMAQVPLLLSMDAEWGLGMRLDSVINLPKQMTLGAANDTTLAYNMGMAVAYQCKRIGVHVNFAPVVDVNNNPANPVINARSFGENKYKVSRLAIAYMRGMQENGIMACAKHFPGHGDVSVDSHKDLPVIDKSRAQLDTLELYPFRQLINAGVQSVMVAHLSVPALESAEHVPTTLSKNVVTGLLKNELGFKGLSFTDALDMKGVAKYFAPGDVDVRAFLAGNDVLLFSQDVPTAITKIKEAISAGKVSTKELELRVKKILNAKYDAGLAHFQPIETANLAKDLNQYTRPLNLQVATAAMTLVRDRAHLVPVKSTERVFEIILGETNWDTTSRSILYGGGSYQSITVKKGESFAKAELALNTRKSPWDKQGTFDVAIIRVQGMSFYPGKNYGLDDDALRFLAFAAAKPNVIITLMGNAYAIKYVCDAGTILCCYEDNPFTRLARDQVLGNIITAKGTLPVTPPCMK